MAFIAWLHGLLFRGCWWLLRLPFRTLWATILSVLALLGEETRRWAGLAVSGLLIFLAGKGTMSFAPAEVRRPLVLAVLLLTVIWALAVRRAAHFTAHNNLIKVRQRQAFKDLRGDVKKLSDRRGEVVEGVARRAKGTPAERVFRSNREDRAKAEAAAERRRVRAEQQQAEAAAEAERLDDLAAAEPNPY